MKISPLMLLPPAAFAAFAAMFYLGLMRDDPDAIPSARVGQEAPPVELTQLGDNVPFDDAALRDGEVKLVNYWASWCGPCRAEHPMLEQIAEQGVPIYGVNYKDDPDNALAFLEELGNPFAAMGADSSGRLALDWGIAGVPETFVVDGDGKIVMRFAGPISQGILDDRIQPAIDSAAGES